MAQAIRASLLASAIAATLAGRRASNAVIPRHPAVSSLLDCDFSDLRLPNLF
jgi:hypothetical protein